ncbi:MAG: hypothetical protein SPJ65_06225 [Roseburia sp.]|nr:hypothetical protein [Roseburia sp.]
MWKIKFIKDHECDTLKSVEAISVEKYNVNGNVDWFHHLYLENEVDKLMAIMYCPYCGCKLD